MDKKLIFTKSIHLVIAIILLIPLLAGCAPAANPTTVATEAVANTVQPTEVATQGAANTVQPTQEALPTAPQATTPPAKKTFTFGRYMDAINPDPVMNDANADIWYIQQYYSGLLRFKPDNTVEADLAEKWDVSSDGLTWTFTLRPDLKFCDGTPITPDDWVWSLDRARDSKNGIWSFTLDAVDKVEATNSTIVFKLKNPYVPFVYSAALFNAVVMPKAMVEAAGGWEKFREHPCGAGPYIMKEWVKGDHMLLVRNPYYWEKGKPVIDEIMIKTITDDNTRILALQKGDVDAINYTPFNRVDELAKDPNLNVTKFPSTFTNYITINNRVKPFDDPRVRAALSYAIDRTALIKTVNFGIGDPATSFRPRGSLYYNDTLPGWPYDVAKAKALLKEAGYENGFKTEFAIAAGSQSAQQIATIVKGMWAQIGVDATIQIQESGLYNDNYYNNKYIIQLNGWTDDIPDPSEETNYAMVNATSECFHTGYKNAEVDKLAADAVKETDPTKRQQMYFQIQEIFNKDIPFIPLYHEPLVIVAKKTVTNFFQTSLGTYLWRDIDITQ